MAQDRHIISAKIVISPSRLVTISGIPAGWNFTIRNDPAGRIEITGGGAVGAAMIYPDDLSKMMFQIEDDQSPEPVHCAGDVQSTVDFATVQTIKFGSSACTKVVP